MQSEMNTRNSFTVQSEQPAGLHVAIIMDGNGRWAARRNLPRVAGHRAGVAAVRRIVEHAPNVGIGRLTVYAFSSDNWRRPAAEVQTGSPSKSPGTSCLAKRKQNPESPAGRVL